MNNINKKCKFTQFLAPGTGQNRKRLPVAFRLFSFFKLKIILIFTLKKHEAN